MAHEHLLKPVTDWTPEEYTAERERAANITQKTNAKIESEMQAWNKQYWADVRAGKIEPMDFHGPIPPFI